jgi:hypothetical protein
MKKQTFTSTLLIVLLVGMFACSKSSVALFTTFKFDAGGNTYQWNGGEGSTFNCLGCFNSITKFSDHYLLRVTGTQNFLNSIQLKINSTVLSKSTYTLTTTSILTVPNLPNAVLASSTEIGDFATVTITSIHDGNYAHGVFNAKLTLSAPINSSNKIDITNGVFHNLKIQ